ncbi:hypothetical protein [uncultured Selenomonas sp.]|uniref:hypothetical protein n=1 Tax=uncultured Selenomonas sp. TaxID=159275 RepID=UPI0025F1E7D1|nr:hypothetical protein [uncultured Selenomonas sp.]
MLDMPFNEAVYGEMAAFFSEKDAGDILLFGMASAWEERFRQDFPSDVFQTASLHTEVPETWHGSFSLIVAAPGIEEVAAVESLLEYLHVLLTPGGALIVPFRNVCHWSVFQSWCDGEMRYSTNPLLRGQGRLFSFPEIIRLAKLSHYEALSVRRIAEAGEPQLLRLLRECGAEDEGKNPEIAWWIIHMTAIPMGIVRLKARYTAEVRHLLARLLHRLENGVEEEASLVSLRQLLVENGIEAGYLEEFVKSVAADAARLLDILRKEGLFG